MKQNKQYRIDLWLFIGSISVLLYLLFMNLMFEDSGSNTFKAIMEWITIPIFIMGAFIPLVVIFRFIVKKTVSTSLAILTLLFSLLAAVMIGYTTLA
ncbi:hypothetical protein [Gelidibacter maritimus]|uniref:Uncharacterized protein n=1 Tax=Gelidibacter maritimus TaxID=2761487 RepID=A0A7W2M6L1_9FLAO|nr:hypothetical protein [Gelidibacter maritimus]MBA6153653.1 hypothetical protein [Gelidibacter maritimus]